MSLDANGVARAAIESLAENFSDGVVAPVFWYLLFGLPGLFAYKMANTLDSMIGHRTPQYRSFGWAAARLDDILNTVPAPLSGLLLATAAAFAKNCRPGHALMIMLRDGRKAQWPGRSVWRWRGRAATPKVSWPIPGSATAPHERRPPTSRGRCGSTASLA
jgi:adenosylcobinamide-phosphate synthase